MVNPKTEFGERSVGLALRNQRTGELLAAGETRYHQTNEHIPRPDIVILIMFGVQVIA